MMFGVGLWAVGSQGWMPGLGVQEATTEKPPKKWPMPVIAHVVYGVTTGVAYEAIAEHRRAADDNLRRQRILTHYGV